MKGEKKKSRQSCFQQTVYTGLLSRRPPVGTRLVLWSPSFDVLPSFLSYPPSVPHCTPTRAHTPMQMYTKWPKKKKNKFRKSPELFASTPPQLLLFTLEMNETDRCSTCLNSSQNTQAGGVCACVCLSLCLVALLGNARTGVCVHGRCVVFGRARTHVCLKGLVAGGVVSLFCFCDRPPRPSSSPPSSSSVLSVASLPPPPLRRGAALNSGTKRRCVIPHKLRHPS